MAHEGGLNAEAGLAGGGVGTFILVLADRLPADYGLLKTLLIYSSPALSVALAAAWLVVAAALRRRRRRSEMESLIAEARAMRAVVCADPNASDEHKQRVCENVEEFEAIGMDLLRDEAEILRTQLKAIR